MKVGFLFAGQYRPYEIALFQKSLKNLVKGLDYSIFSFCWRETGKSLTNNKDNLAIRKVPNIEKEINKIFEGFNLKAYEFAIFDEFKKNLSIEHKEILNSKKFHAGTINSLPQIYTIYKCYQLLLPFLDDYDLIFRCRYDSLFIHPLQIYNLNQIKVTKNLYHLNFGRSFNPKRVYDIFFGGSVESTLFLRSIWDDLPELIFKNVNNILDRRDSCRLIYLGAKKNNINIRTLQTRVCDVYRMEGNLEYEKYLISSHLTTLTLNRTFFQFFIYFYKWINFRKFSKIKMIFLIIKSLILAPLSFCRRVKFIRFNL